MHVCCLNFNKVSVSVLSGEVLHACEQGELYRSLMRVALQQQDKIKSIIQDTIASEEESVLQCAANCQLAGSS